MALDKQDYNIGFGQGVNTKVDPYQIPIGQFLSLNNSVFDTSNRLTKRNGFGLLSTLPDSTNLFLTTFNDNLTAIGTSLNAYSASSASWYNKGSFKPINLSTLSLIRSNFNQTQVDAVVAPNGLVCTVYTDVGTSTAYKYAIANSITGQNIIAPTAIPVTSGTVTGSPRVFVLGNYFIIVFTNVITATSHLQYIAISLTTPTNVTTNADIASSYVSATTLSWDGIVANNRLFIAYNTTTGGQAIKMTYLPATLGTPVTAVTFSSRIATMMSLTADNTTASNPIIYASFYDAAGSTGYTLCVDQNLNTVHSPVQIISSGTVLNITSTAKNAVCTVFYEVSNTYGYDGSIHSNFIKTNTITQSGTVGTASTLVRSVGLASKATLVSGTSYFLGVYSSTYQPTYFLINGSGQVVSKLAYSNGAGYLTLGLPNLLATDTLLQAPYLVKDLVQAANKTQGVSSSAPVYTQTGINLASFETNPVSLSTAEIGKNLHLSGGFLWAYDGYIPVEQGFFLYPDNVEVSTSTSGGSITAQQYYYQATYEWSDNQGNIFRSAPSLPITVTTTGATSTNTINVPTLRLTYKTANPVKIVVYRWSVAQQTFYQVTSITTPTLNSTTTDSVAITDTLADSSIIGNNILYTTGGVLENIAPPATNCVTLFDNRLFLLDAEDPNLLWFSKQVLENTPVEMSDLLTIYTAPTTGAQGSTGPTKTMAPMDDKLILGKKDALYYINGTGPDITGSNEQYSQAIFITSTVGCENQQSIVFQPNGLMFQSDKGIWLLARDLSTTFIGAPVQGYTAGALVKSALSIPGTNQVRFTMDSGITLMYDYYYNQWGVFKGIPSIASTLNNSLHTYLDSTGKVFQETPGQYLDGSNPVLMSFTTGWLNFAGLQGYERIYQMLFLGTYLTPFKLNCQIAYDYNSSAQQSTNILPDNFNYSYGLASVYGATGPNGGPPNVFEARVFNNKQKISSMQLTVEETYDPSYGIAAGAGLTLSGITVTTGIKKGRRPSRASQSFG